MKNRCLGFYLATMALMMVACSPDQSIKDTVLISPPPTVTVTDEAVPNKAIDTKIPVLPKTSKLVTKAPMPSWAHVDKLPKFPTNRMDEIKNGIAYLAADDRVQLTDDGYEYFSRVAYKVTERKGLESGAEITLKFDPKLESLIFNYVNITRNSKVVERLDGIEIQELQRESSLGDGILDGNITAMIQIEDVRVGDIIDYGYSGVNRTKLWPGHYFNNFSTSYTVPIARQTFEISVPRQTRLTTDTINDAPRPKITDVGDRTIYHYNVKDPDPYQSWSNVPDTAVIKPYVLISSMSSWQEVSNWGVEVYELDMTLPATMKKKLKKITKTKKTSQERMIEAFRFVQSDIRYLGIESGVNSHKPRIPMVTLSNGYGDCKDKSLLLVAALQTMNITAYPALVSTNSGHALDQLLPSIGVFNHVIVMAQINDKTYWLDPTLSYQGGSADELAPLDYGYVLPIKKGQTELVYMDFPATKIPTSKVTETYTLPEKISSDQVAKKIGMTLDVISIYTGSDADTMRRKIVKTGRKNLSKDYHDYYADLYPSLTKAGDFVITDDFEANKIVVTEHYALSRENYEKNKLEETLLVKAV